MTVEQAEPTFDERSQYARTILQHMFDDPTMLGLSRGDISHDSMGGDELATDWRKSTALRLHRWSHDGVRFSYVATAKMEGVSAKIVLSGGRVTLANFEDENDVINSSYGTATKQSLDNALSVIELAQEDLAIR